MSEWQPIETAPTDKRILGYGIVAFEVEPGIATVRWNDYHKAFLCNPNECSEYAPEECELTHWMPLPEPPK
jgi:hypothetical protein